MERSRLPVEVCERIIDLAAINPPYDTRYDGTESIVDYQTLLACVLVCHAWRPRARYHLFYRVIVDSPKHLNLFLTAAENGVHARELELSLPLETGVLYEGRPRHGDQFGVSFAAPAFAQAVNHVKLLILSKTEWLYPRKYIGILASCFSSLTALDLCRTYFPTGGDLARLLWSFPRLCYLECNEVGVTCGGMSRLPTPARTSEPQSFPRIATLTLNSCSFAAPFIIRSTAFPSAAITYIYLRSSFARWQSDHFSVFTALVNLQRFDLVLASPMRLTRLPLPASLGLIELYRQASHAILYNLALSGAQSASLRTINLTYEPGEGSWRVLSGRDQDQAGDIPAETDDLGVNWTYEQRRSTAIEVLFGEMDDIFVDSDTKAPRPAFARLLALRLRVWDTNTGMDDSWWSNEISRRLPALSALGVLGFEVTLGWTMMENELWITES